MVCFVNLFVGVFLFVNEFIFSVVFLYIRQRLMRPSFYKFVVYAGMCHADYLDCNTGDFVDSGMVYHPRYNA